MELFKRNRIRVQELIQDTVTYLTDQFKQNAVMFTVASAYGQIIFVIQQIVQLVLYYIEDSITELNINQATRQNSIYGLAALTGHNPTRSVSAIGTISLGWNGESDDVPGGIIIIPKHNKIKCENNGLTYLVDTQEEDVRLRLETGQKLDVNIIQGTLESQTFQGLGTPLQSFEVNFKKNVQVEHFNVRVFVNSEEWRVSDSFYDMGKDSKRVFIKTGLTSGIDVFFGNGFFGAMPPAGSEIRVDYIISDGSRGNMVGILPEEASFKWEDSGFSLFGDDLDLNALVRVQMKSPPDFGSNPEPLALTKLIAPKNSRNFVFANADNYIIFFEKFNQFSIIDAYSTFDDDYLDDDNVIYLFLVPDIRKRLTTNENYFTVPEDRFVLNNFQKQQILNLIEKSGGKIVTTVIDIKDPIIRKYVLNINITIFERFNPDVIKEKIVNRLSDYFLAIRRRDKIPRSDLIAIIEDIVGVDSVNLNFVSKFEEDEKLKVNPNVRLSAPPAKDLDSFGDIIIGRDVLPIIRGGWTDANGFEYIEGLDMSKPSSVNINIQSVTPVNYNTLVNDSTKSNIKNKPKPGDTDVSAPSISM
jgi:hypothetical protein